MVCYSYAIFYPRGHLWWDVFDGTIIAGRLGGNNRKTSRTGKCHYWHYWQMRHHVSSWLHFYLAWLFPLGLHEQGRAIESASTQTNSWLRIGGGNVTATVEIGYNRPTLSELTASSTHTHLIGWAICLCQWDLGQTNWYHRRRSDHEKYLFYSRVPL